ncbi:MAG: hypothetical protein M3P33_02225 [bacterium]|nr:hypothetical protein [bacterium]
MSSYTGGQSLAAATVLPATSGALYLWSKEVNSSVAMVFAAVSILSLLYTTSVVYRYLKNKHNNN